MVVLANRHVTKVSSCLICSVSCEDIKHILCFIVHTLERFGGNWVFEKLLKKLVKLIGLGVQFLIIWLQANLLKQWTGQGLISVK